MMLNPACQPVGVHYEAILKEEPGSVVFDYDDALKLVDCLRSDDNYAHSLANNALVR